MEAIAAILAFVCVALLITILVVIDLHGQVKRLKEWKRGHSSCSDDGTVHGRLSKIIKHNQREALEHSNDNLRLINDLAKAVKFEIIQEQPSKGGYVVRKMETKEKKS